MGIAGELEHPDLQKVQQEILRTCQKFDVVAGIHVVKPDHDELFQRIEEGYRFLPFSLDITIISEASKGVIQFIKANKDSGEGH